MEIKKLKNSVEEIKNTRVSTTDDQAEEFMNLKTGLLKKPSQTKYNNKIKNKKE